jgi:hypothetical protein
MRYYFERDEIKTCEDCPLLDAEQGCFCLLNEKAVRDFPGENTTIPEWCQLKRGENTELIAITFEEAGEHIENDEEVYFQESKGCTLKRVKRNTTISTTSADCYLKNFLKGQFYLKRKDEEA